MGRRLVERLVRLVLAGALLWWDQRLFLFYGFTILLRIWNDLDRLRAGVRVIGVLNEARLIALARHAGVPREFLAEAMDDSKARLSREDRESLDADFRLLRDEWGW